MISQRWIDAPEKMKEKTKRWLERNLKIQDALGHMLLCWNTVHMGNAWLQGLPLAILIQNFSNVCCKISIYICVKLSRYINLHRLTTRWDATDSPVKWSYKTQRGWSDNAVERYSRTFEVNHSRASRDSWYQHKHSRFGLGASMLLWKRR